MTGRPLQDEILAKLRRAAVDGYVEVSTEAPYVTGQTRNSLTPFVEDPSEALGRVHAEAPIDRAGADARLESWTSLDQVAGFATAHPAYPRLASGASKQAKPGWIQDKVRQVARRGVK